MIFSLTILLIAFSHRADHVEVFICDSNNYSTWLAGGNVTKYASKTELQSGTIGSFIVPYSGTWYLVFVATGEPDTITIPIGFNIETSGTVTTTTPTTSTQPNTSTQSNTDTTNIPWIPWFSSDYLFLIMIAIVGLVSVAVLWQVTKRKRAP
ncbi:MAG: hypothetical protein K9W43_06350 [Candidatus Thorarchaeota archaeon]|nr:hypothetical protein [Candidatus Thorarchaeota archaeon]